MGRKTRKIYHRTPDHGKHERFAEGPSHKRSNAGGALKQQLLLTPLSVSSVVGFGPGGGHFWVSLELLFGVFLRFWKG